MNLDPRVADNLWRTLPHTYAAHASGGRWLPYKHCVILGRAIAECVAKPDGRLLVLMPPRHGKSEEISFWTPTWYLDLFPQKRVMLASYAADLAQGFGRRVRNEIKTNPHVDVLLAEDSQAKGEWHTRDGGGMVSTGLDGSVTGKGGDLIIVDDIVKNWEQARSMAYHKKCRDWFDTTLYTRLEPEGSMIVLMTPWHEADLAGYLQGEHEDNWTVLRLPAICEEQKLGEERDPLGRKEGEALCPDRYPVKRLKAIKKAVGVKGWNGLFQCRPSALEGNIFKREDIQYYRNLPETLSQKITSWDFTFKKSSTADYVVGQAWGRVGADKYLFPFQFRKQCGFRDSKKGMVALKKRYPAIMSHLVEAKANGDAIMDDLGKTISGLKPINPGESKEARAEAVSDQWGSLNIYLPHPDICEGELIDDKPWILAFVEELMNFPNAKNDDMVDAMTQALAHLSEFELDSLENFLTL